MIVRAVVGKTGIVTVTDEEGRNTQILLDDRGEPHRVMTTTTHIPKGVNCSIGHVVEVAIDYPVGAMPPFPRRVNVICPEDE